MRQVLSKLHSPVTDWMIYPLACALVVIGAKIWMIAQYGSPTPYWDQWDAEGAILYPKYFDGTLSFSDLIAPHNEHRILITRLWSLLLLCLAGYWDPILQMLANTAILGAFVALLVTAFRPILDGVSWIALVLFSTVIFALPFGWESTLAGFQSPWYFMLLFSIAGLYAIIDATAFTPHWWTALLLLLISYFSLASGALTVAAAFATCVVQFVVGRRSSLKELLALAILAALTAVTVLYTPQLPGHAPLKAHSIEQFLRAFMEIASWPATTGHKGTAILVLGAILIQAPSALVSIRIIGLRLPLTDRRWLLVALTGWAVLQAASIAYGRAVGATSPRYLDVFAVALTVNFACLLHLLVASEVRLRKCLAFGATALWLLAVLFGMTKGVFTLYLPQMEEKRATGYAQTQNLHAYLDTGDIATLENKPFLAIPFPDPQRLAIIVSQPIIRALLPPALVGEASAARAQQRGLARFTGRPIEALKNYALRWGVLLIPTGLTFFLLGLTMRSWCKASWSESAATN